MILLDTNVVSEVMRPKPQESVLDWLNSHRTEALHISAITIAEIGYGLHVLPAGKRRQMLEGRFDLFIASGFAQRVLPFDQRAARLYADLMGQRRKLGQPMSILDGQIAAIARANRFAVATRNVRDFERCGLENVNPFDFEGMRPELLTRADPPKP